jgi:L-fuculose-phosphate aldolase
MEEGKAREFICEIGRRAYAREFAAANDGNLSFRLTDNEVLATPTLVCKGFMKPHELVKLDMSGTLLEGFMPPTSETKLHLGIYKERPDVKAVVHLHPPHATAFAIAGVPVDKCVLPEVEIFLGEVPIAEYRTPGTQDFFESIRPYIKDYSVMLLANHGVVTLGRDLQEAYWRMEITDAYCRMLILARQLGQVNKITLENMERLFDIKQRLGIPDRRMEKPGIDPCAINGTCGLTPPTGERSAAGKPPIDDASVAEIVRRVTDEVSRRLRGD